MLDSFYAHTHACYSFAFSDAQAMGADNGATPHSAPRERLIFFFPACHCLRYFSIARDAHLVCDASGSLPLHRLHIYACALARTVLLPPVYLDAVAFCALQRTYHWLPCRSWFHLACAAGSVPLFPPPTIPRTIPLALLAYLPFLAPTAA